jgi:hypothetical protein
LHRRTADDDPLVLASVAAMLEEIGDRAFRSESGRAFGSESGRHGFADLHLTLANRAPRPGRRDLRGS